MKTDTASTDTARSMAHSTTDAPRHEHIWLVVIPFMLAFMAMSTLWLSSVSVR